MRLKIRCTCKQKIAITVKAGDWGKRVTVTCAKCKARLRARLPDAPTAAGKFRSLIRCMVGGIR